MSVAMLELPARRPRSFLTLTLLLTVAALALMYCRLRPETTLQGLLDPSEPSVRAMGRVLDEFPVANELLLLVSLPDDGAADPSPAPLLAFAKRLEEAIAHDPQASSLVAQFRYRVDPQSRRFVEQVVIPGGLYYLSDESLAQAMHRLTRSGMDQQLARDQQMLGLPGPNAAALARTLAKDPLRLHELLLAQARNFSLPGQQPGSAGIDSDDTAFLAPDGCSLLIRISGVRSTNDFSFARQLTAAVQRKATELNDTGLRLDIAGGYAMAAHSADRIRSDSISDVVSTVLGLAILFVIACRHPVRLFAYAFGPVAAGILWGFGAYALFRHAITPLAAVVGGTLGAIGLDYTIHFIAHFQEIRGDSDSHEQGVRRTARELFLPSLAAWMTSVIGFAAVAISPVRVLRDFAILGTLCLIGTWAATLLTLPAMLVLAPPRRSGQSMFAIRFDVAGAIGRWIAGHARGLLILSSTILAILLVCMVIRGVRFRLDSDPMVLHPRPSPPLAAQHRIAERMQMAGGQVIVHLRAGSPAELLTLAHDVSRRLEMAPLGSAGIILQFGIASLLPDPRVAQSRRASLDPNLPQRVEDNFRAALADSDFRPGAYDDYIAFLRKLVAPRPAPDVSDLLDYPQLARVLLPRSSLDAHVAPSEAVTLLFTRQPLETGEARQAALEVVETALHDMPGVTVTGTAVIAHDLEAAIHRDVPRFFSIALACIAIYLLVHFRSPKLAALALLPIAISMLCVAAFVSLGGVRLNILHTVMVPLLLGINLDYGIFAVHAWHTSRDQRELSSHFPAAFAALIICGGSTTIGFGSLIITSVPAVESLGWLINVGVSTCVLATMLVLWPGMMLAAQRRLTRRR